MKSLINKTIKRLEKEKELLGKRRDSLRDFRHEIEELEELEENCNTAIQDLECAIDKLSELV